MGEEDQDLPSRSPSGSPPSSRSPTHIHPPPHIFHPHLIIIHQIHDRRRPSPSTVDRQTTQSEIRRQGRGRREVWSIYLSVTSNIPRRTLYEYRQTCVLHRYNSRTKTCTGETNTWRDFQFGHTPSLSRSLSFRTETVTLYRTLLFRVISHCF